MGEWRAPAGFLFFVRLMKVWVGSESHGNVNVFEDATRSDAEDPVTGFHQVVAFTATVLAAEGVGEGETGIQLFGFD